MSRARVCRSSPCDMPANLSKRSVVKHRTNKAQHAGDNGPRKEGTGANSMSLGETPRTGKGKRKSGFQVGPKHAPDGAYLGRGE